MAIKKKPYFYDAQVKRVLTQVMSAFAGYQVVTGVGRDGKVRRRTVPIVYGDMSRVVGYIIGPQVSQTNIIGSLPIMSLHITSLKQSDIRRQSPQYAEKVSYVERLRDPDGKPIIGQPGKRKMVERWMPTFYDMGVQLSLWVENNDSGFQLLEQILQVFNPEMDILISNSPTDWTFITTMFFDGEVGFEKVVPSGGETDPLYVYHLNFSLTIPISPPAKLYDAKLIEHIHVPLYELDEIFQENGLDGPSGPLLDGLVIDIDDEDVLKIKYAATGKKGGSNEPPPP
ncbi:MAG: hypothetical protein D6698_10245 [Gammaproteobacteria bacterium]|nr:MAG: hypothetical protein D6698_10245 [Gammaproteobacteria bacterium]